MSVAACLSLILCVFLSKSKYISPLHCILYTAFANFGDFTYRKVISRPSRAPQSSHEKENPVRARECFESLAHQAHGFCLLYSLCNFHAFISLAIESLLLIFLADKITFHEILLFISVISFTISTQNNKHEYDIYSSTQWVAISCAYFGTLLKGVVEMVTHRCKDEKPDDPLSFFLLAGGFVVFHIPFFSHPLNFLMAACIVTMNRFSSFSPIFCHIYIMPILYLIESIMNSAWPSLLQSLQFCSFMIVLKMLTPPPRLSLRRLG